LLCDFLSWWLNTKTQRPKDSFVATNATISPKGTLKNMTLLESCATIALLSTATLFATPSIMKARDNYQLDMVARQVAGKMQWTRIKAISRYRDCRLRVIAATSYAIECQDPTWQADEIVAMPRGFRVTSTATPEFHVRGNVAPTATLVVWDAHSHTKRVIVNITGRVRVE
jgi:hypothetical protein